MDKKEAQGIANETLYILVQCKERFKGAYEFFMGEMDITDEEIDKANKILNK
jgi:hypothetical protein